MMRIFSLFMQFIRFINSHSLRTTFRLFSGTDCKVTAYVSFAEMYFVDYEGF